MHTFVPYVKLKARIVSVGATVAGGRPVYFELDAAECKMSYNLS